MSRRDGILLRILNLIESGELTCENGFCIRTPDGTDCSIEEIQILCEEAERGTYIDSKNGAIPKWIESLNNFTFLERMPHGLENTYKIPELYVTNEGKKMMEKLSKSDVPQIYVDNSQTITGDNNSAASGGSSATTKSNSNKRWYYPTIGKIVITLSIGISITIGIIILKVVGVF